MISHYGAAVYLYYYEDLKEVYEKCSCRNGNPFEFEIQNEEDLREVSKTIAELNTVISDQWNYTPGLEFDGPGYSGNTGYGRCDEGWFCKENLLHIKRL